MRRQSPRIRTMGAPSETRRSRGGISRDQGLPRAGATSMDRRFPRDRRLHSRLSVRRCRSGRGRPHRVQRRPGAKGDDSPVQVPEVAGRGHWHHQRAQKKARVRPDPRRTNLAVHPRHLTAATPPCGAFRSRRCDDWCSLAGFRGRPCQPRRVFRLTRATSSVHRFPTPVNTPGAPVASRTGAVSGDRFPHDVLTPTAISRSLSDWKGARSYEP